MLTLSSLFLECACIFTIWPQATRLLTVAVMFALHIGIELAMNMHCFEWLSVLGWLMFTVEEPKRETVDDDVNILEGKRDGESNGAALNKENVANLVGSINGKAKQSEGIETTTAKQTEENGSKKVVDDKNCTSKPRSGFLQKLVVNVFVFAVLTAFFIDTAPLYQFHKLTPQQYKTISKPVYKFRNRFKKRYLVPVTTPLGLDQGTWDMFSGPPSEIFQYEGIVMFDTGKSVHWFSPDWRRYTWYEKKRWQRPMTFYDNLAESKRPMLDSFALYLANKYGSDDVVSVKLLLNVLRSLEPPEEAAFFDKALRDFDTGQTTIHVLNFCDDADDRCEAWEDEGLCNGNSKEVKKMMKYCRRSCRDCADADDVPVNARIALIWEEDGKFYDATVREVKESPKKYRIEFDKYQDDHERFEWVDPIDLRLRYFYFLGSEEEEKDEPYNEEENDDDEEEDEERSARDEL